MFERRGPFRIGYQRGNVPANRGRVCLKRKLVYSPWYDQKVWRCASYGGRATRSLFAGRQKPRRNRDTVYSPGLFAGRQKPLRRRSRGILQILFGPVEGRVPLSLPSMERQRAGRTSRGAAGWRPTPRSTKRGQYLLPY